MSEVVNVVKFKLFFCGEVAGFCRVGEVEALMKWWSCLLAEIARL